LIKKSEGLSSFLFHNFIDHVRVKLNFQVPQSGFQSLKVFHFGGDVFHWREFVKISLLVKFV
jgi:hypothetical protein